MKPMLADLDHGAPRGPGRFVRALAAGLVLAASLAPSSHAQGAPTAVLGLERLPIFAPDRLSVEINLDGSLLKIVAGSLAEEDPDFAALISGLRSIKVRVTEAGDAIDSEVQKEIHSATAGLGRDGWQSLMRMQEEDEETSIYLKQDGERIQSLLVVFVEVGEEAGLVHVDGEIDLLLLGRLISKLDSEHFANLTEALKNPPAGVPDKQPAP